MEYLKLAGEKNMIKHNIIGNAMQMLVTELSPGDEIYGEAGKFLWKTANVDMDTRFGSQKHEGKSFLDKAIGTAIDMGKRSLAGESVAFVHFTPMGGEGKVSFAQMIPGRSWPWNWMDPRRCSSSPMVYWLRKAP